MSNKQKQLKLKKAYEFNLNLEEKTILILALEYMRREIAQFLDKKAEYGNDMYVTLSQIQDLKEYLTYRLFPTT